MRVTVFGGTGMIGREIVAEATSRNHEVTVVSRRPCDFGGNVRSVSADMTDLQKVSQIAHQSDVVVSAMGPSRENDADRLVWAARLAAFARTMEGTRLIVVGGAGTLLVAPGVRHLDSPAFDEVYRDEAVAVAEGFDALQSLPEEIDWVFVSPPVIIEPGVRTGKYARGWDEPVGGSISTQDFAVALLDEIEAPRVSRRRFTVAN